MTAWYAARAGGVVAYALLTLVVLLGLTLSSRRTLPFWPRFAVEDVHRFAGLLAGAFVTLHGVGLLLDTHLPFSIGALVVPFLSGYRGPWLGLGVVAGELMAALALTNRYRTRLPYRFWRRAHVLFLAVWAGSTLHAIGTGTDSGAAWLVALYAVSVGAVCAALVRQLVPRGALGHACGAASAARPAATLRLLSPTHYRRRRRLRLLVPAAGALAAGAIAVVAAGSGLRARPAAAAAREPASYRGTLTGTIERRDGASASLVSFVGSSRAVRVRADLLTDGSETEATSFQLEYVASGRVHTGTVTSVDDSGFTATLAGGGATRDVRVDWAGGGGGDDVRVAIAVG